MGGPSIVARRLREARKRTGVSQRKIGIKAGINESTASTRINQYERGKHMPGLHIVARLAAVMRMPVPYFYCQDKELADVIVKFSTLGETQRKRLLGSMDEL